MSAVERGVTKTPSAIRRVRSAIVYLELEPRRRRAWERAEAEAVDVVEAAVLLHRTDVIVARLVDLLFEGRSEDFDALALRVDPAISATAGERYLDGIEPTLP